MLNNLDSSRVLQENLFWLQDMQVEMGNLSIDVKRIVEELVVAISQHGGTGCIQGSVVNYVIERMLQKDRDPAYGDIDAGLYYFDQDGVCLDELQNTMEKIRNSVLEVFRSLSGKEDGQFSDYGRYTDTTLKHGTYFIASLNISSLNGVPLDLSWIAAKEVGKVAFHTMNVNSFRMVIERQQDGFFYKVITLETAPLKDVIKQVFEDRILHFTGNVECMGGMEWFRYLSYLVEGFVAGADLRFQVQYDFARLPGDFSAFMKKRKPALFIPVLIVGVLESDRMEIKTYLHGILKEFKTEDKTPVWLRFLCEASNQVSSERLSDLFYFLPFFAQECVGKDHFGNRKLRSKLEWDCPFYILTPSLEFSDKVSLKIQIMTQYIQGKDICEAVWSRCVKFMKRSQSSSSSSLWEALLVRALLNKAEQMSEIYAEFLKEAIRLGKDADIGLLNDAQRKKYYLHGFQVSKNFSFFEGILAGGINAEIVDGLREHCSLSDCENGLEKLLEKGDFRGCLQLLQLWHAITGQVRLDWCRIMYRSIGNRQSGEGVYREWQEWLLDVESSQEYRSRLYETLYLMPIAASRIEDSPGVELGINALTYRFHYSIAQNDFDRTYALYGKFPEKKRMEMLLTLIDTYSVEVIVRRLLNEGSDAELGKIFQELKKNDQKAARFLRAILQLDPDRFLTYLKGVGNGSLQKAFLTQLLQEKEMQVDVHKDVFAKIYCAFPYLDPYIEQCMVRGGSPSWIGMEAVQKKLYKKVEEGNCSQEIVCLLAHLQSEEQRISCIHKVCLMRNGVWVETVAQQFPSLAPQIAERLLVKSTLDLFLKFMQVLPEDVAQAVVREKCLKSSLFSLIVKHRHFLSYIPDADLMELLRDSSVEERTKVAIVQDFRMEKFFPENVSLCTPQEWMKLFQLARLSKALMCRYVNILVENTSRYAEQRSFLSSCAVHLSSESIERILQDVENAIDGIADEQTLLGCLNLFEEKELAGKLCRTQAGHQQLLNLSGVLLKEFPETKKRVEDVLEGVFNLIGVECSLSVLCTLKFLVRTHELKFCWSDHLVHVLKNNPSMIAHGHGRKVLSEIYGFSLNNCNILLKNAVTYMQSNPGEAGNWMPFFKEIFSFFASNISDTFDEKFLCDTLKHVDYICSLKSKADLEEFFQVLNLIGTVLGRLFDGVSQELLFPRVNQKPFTIIWAEIVNRIDKIATLFFQEIFDMWVAGPHAIQPELTVEEITAQANALTVSLDWYILYLKKQCILGEKADAWYVNMFWILCSMQSAGLEEVEALYNKVLRIVHAIDVNCVERSPSLIRFLSRQVLQLMLWPAFWEYHSLYCSYADIKRFLIHATPISNSYEMSEMLDILMSLSLFLEKKDLESNNLVQDKEQVFRIANGVFYAIVDCMLAELPFVKSDEFDANFLEKMKWILGYLCWMLEFECRDIIQLSDAEKNYSMEQKKDLYTKMNVYLSKVLDSLIPIFASNEYMVQILDYLMTLWESAQGGGKTIQTVLEQLIIKLQKNQNKVLLAKVQSYLVLKGVFMD